MATVANLDPTAYESTAAGDFTLGAEYSYGNKVFRFIRNANGASDNALADGDVCVWAATSVSGTTINTNVVSNNLAGTGTGLPANPVAGVAVRVIAKNSYGFIQIRGLHTNVKSTGTTAGLAQKISATAATCTDQTAATIKTLGVALTATSGGRCSVELSC